MSRVATLTPGTIAATPPGDAQPGIRQVLGEAAWQRLPPPVRARFSEGLAGVTYTGRFDVVRASPLGLVIARLGRLLGTPVVPWTGVNVPAVVHVRPVGSGIAWIRDYQRADGSPCRVRSVKVVTAVHELVERLPAGVCMPLAIHEDGGVLHFVSRGYYFRVPLPGGREWRIRLPAWCSPGETHVEHRDEADGWFRFSMTVTHPRLGELFYQTGRFRAAD